MTPLDYYRSAIEKSHRETARLSRKAFAIAMLRLGVFSATAIAVYATWGNSIATAILLAGIACFLFLAQRSNRIAHRKAAEKAKADWAQSNIDRLHLELDKLPDGKEYIDTGHDFSYDIDLFGRHSLFSLLATTTTPQGNDVLARWLTKPATIVGQVEERQTAVRELSRKNEFRIEMAAAGMQANENHTTGKTDAIPDFSLNAFQKATLWIAPLLYIALFILATLDIISGTTIFYVFLCMLAIASAQAKRVSKLHSWATGTAAIIARQSGLFRTIEEETFDSPLLIKLQNKIDGSAGKASLHASRLSRLIGNLDQRYNAFGYVLLNGFLFWDWRQLHHIDRWMKANGAKMAEWTETIAEIDAYCALATFAFNFPEYTYPILDPCGKTVMEARQAGHPLLKKEKCVPNDVKSLSSGSFFVITGANMAGKSTYLRTVAVNYLLAQIGAPVFASHMTFSAAPLCTGLRVADSLADGASYFFAELSRLQHIVRRAEKGERMFVILDEILRGTNSADKQKGSLGLVSKLVALNTAGIIATHDLALGKLADVFPGKVENFRFEADIEGDNLSFSYRIQQGIAQNANASFLMRAMGII